MKNYYSEIQSTTRIGYLEQKRDEAKSKVLTHYPNWHHILETYKQPNTRLIYNILQFLVLGYTAANWRNTGIHCCQLKRQWDTLLPTEVYCIVHDFRLPPRSSWELGSSGSLRSVITQKSAVFCIVFVHVRDSPLSFHHTFRDDFIPTSPEDTS